jgi:hypothetical protein
MDEDALNLEIRRFLKEVGITSQREIEKLVRSGAVRGKVLKLRMTLSSETAPLNHIVEGKIDLGSG